MKVKIAIILVILSTILLSYKYLNSIHKSTNLNDSSDMGWFVEPKNGVGSKNKKLIIFVHGVIGDVNKTWTNSSSGAYWPDLVAKDPALDDFDIYTYSYSSPLLSKAMTITQNATRLNSLIERKFDSVDAHNYESIYFVCHSMGNLIVRKAMDYRKYYKDIKVPLIISIAPPSKGSDLANIGNYLSNNPQFAGMLKEANNNNFLESLNIDWIDNHNDTSIAVAYEIQPFPKIGKRIVEIDSSNAICTIKPAMPFNRDHSSIVKPFELLGSS